MQEELDKAYQALCEWESWQGKFSNSGCADGDETLFAYRLMGALTAASVLCEHPRPDEYMTDLLVEVYELINGESNEVDDDD